MVHGPHHGITDVQHGDFNEHTHHHQTVQEVSDGLWEAFRTHHAKLGGAPGQAITSPLPETVGGGRRVRYQNGAIYEAPNGTCAWVYGAINDRYEQLGGALSWLGFPLADEAPFDEDGRISVFEHGAIYFWPDVGAIELNNVLVHYTGLVCFGETDNDGLSPSDEPYVVLGVVAPEYTTDMRTRIYENFDAGESVQDLLELYKGRPRGMVISVLLMEHDDGNPDKYTDVMQNAVRAGFAAAGTAAGAAVPVLIPFIALASPLIAEAASKLGGALSDALGTGDDTLGNPIIQLTAKQMVVLGARAVNADAKGVPYKVETPLMTGEGSSYKAYFSLYATQ